MTTFTVGLTGGLASGKSTVARWLGEAGYAVVDADELVAQLYRPGEPGSAAVREIFGDEVLDSDGSVRHQAVAERVFSDRESLDRLEAAIHPLVRQRFASIAAEAETVAVLEAALLVEAGQTRDFDLVVTVEADEGTRLERAVERGLSREEAQARLASQGDGATRRSAAHVTLNNDGDLDDLREQVDALVDEIDRLRSAL